jgi:predicted AAA+ superfamily ATPase
MPVWKKEPGYWRQGERKLRDGRQKTRLTNFTQMGGQVGFDDKSTRKYVAILEQLFLVRRVWFRNQLKRLVKTPKLHFLDSVCSAHS